MPRQVYLDSFHQPTSKDWEVEVRFLGKDLSNKGRTSHMPSISRRDALKGVSASVGALLTAGCTARDRQTDGTIELLNFSTEPVLFTVAAESTSKPDDQQTPMFRTRYYGIPEESVILPNAIRGGEYRISILVHEEDAGERGAILASGQTTFTPSEQEPTLYVRYDIRGNESVTFDTDL